MDKINQKPSGSSFHEGLWVGFRATNETGSRYIHCELLLVFSCGAAEFICYFDILLSYYAGLFIPFGHLLLKGRAALRSYLPAQ
jgi:hypothetical protein